MSYDSEIVDSINKEYDDYQSELVVRNKKLKLLVSFKEEDELDKLISLLDEAKDIVIGGEVKY